MIKLLLIFGLLAGIFVAAVVLYLLLGRKREVVKLKGPPSSWSVPDSWSFSVGELKGKPLMLRFNTGLRGAIAHPSFAKQLGIAVRFQRPSEDGLPDSQEMKDLDMVEDFVRSQFLGPNVHLFAGIITTGNMREFVVYTSDEKDAAAKAQQVVAKFPQREIQYILNGDPEWNVFQQFAGK